MHKIVIILGYIITLLLTSYGYAAVTPQFSKNDILWQKYSEEIFYPNNDDRLIFLYIKASWCKWCKKTDSTTLKDQTVIDEINHHFKPTKLDIDQDTEIASHYKVATLPAIFILDRNHNILKSLSGYIESKALITILEELHKGYKVGGNSQKFDTNKTNTLSQMPSILPKETRLLLMEKQLLLYNQFELNGGGINKDKKYIGRFSTQYAMSLVLTGNDIAKRWLVVTLTNGEKLVDPVWGGVYAYSTDGDWNHPNYQKPLSAQTLNIRLYIEAYRLTGNVEYKTIAENITDYLINFLISPDGAVYAGQEAKMKLGKQDANYYKLNDSQRRINGIPPINKNIYAKNNAEAIDALTTMYMVTGKNSYLDYAKKITEWTKNHLVLTDGGLKHSTKNNVGFYLGDSLKMSKAWLSLFEATTNNEYLHQSKKTMDFINKKFRNPTGEPGFIHYFPILKNKDVKYKVDKQGMVVLTRHASLLSHYTGEKLYSEMAMNAFRFLQKPEIITTSQPAFLLIANDAISTEPLKITIIGPRNDTKAFELYNTALRFPSFFMQIAWYTTAEEARNVTKVDYPTLSQSAAFFCAINRCSLPLYSPKEFDTIAIELLREQHKSEKTNILSSVTSLFPHFTAMRAQQSFANIFINHNWLLIFIGFWFVGLLLACTPCILPLLFVLSSLLMVSRGLITKTRMFKLTLTYILSLAITYAAVGYTIGLVGVYLQVYLQSAVVLIPISILLILLAFSLLGGYKISLPPSLQHYLISFNNFRASNTYTGAALMGVVVTLIASPCSAAPIIGVLTIMSEIGDPMLGMVALFAMGIGIGTPLLLAGIVSGGIIPKVTEWQHQIQTFFGILLLFVVVWMLSRVVSQFVYMFLLAGLTIVTSIYMGVLNEIKASVFGNFWKTLSIMLFIYGVSLMIGAFIGNNNPYNPLTLNSNTAQPIQPAIVGIFQNVHSEVELNKFLLIARKQNRPVIIDFSASWCESCNKIDRDIFTNPVVSAAMLKFILLRVDLSTKDSGAIAIAKKYNVVAPPVMLFIDNQGNETDTRYYGNMDAKDFVGTLISMTDKN